MQFTPAKVRGRNDKIFIGDNNKTSFSCKACPCKTCPRGTCPCKSREQRTKAGIHRKPNIFLKTLILYSQKDINTTNVTHIYKLHILSTQMY